MTQPSDGGDQQHPRPPHTDGAPAHPSHGDIYHKPAAQPSQGEQSAGHKHVTTPQEQGGHKQAGASPEKPAHKPTTAPHEQPGHKPTTAPHEQTGHKPTTAPHEQPGHKPTTAPHEQTGHKPTAAPHEQPGHKPTTAPHEQTGHKPTTAPHEQTGHKAPGSQDAGLSQLFHQAADKGNKLIAGSEKLIENALGMNAADAKPGKKTAAPDHTGHKQGTPAQEHGLVHLFHQVTEQTTKAIVGGEKMLESALGIKGHDKPAHTVRHDVITKIPHADKLTPQERAHKDVHAYKDDRGRTFHYDDQGRIQAVESVNKTVTTCNYIPGDKSGKVHDFHVENKDGTVLGRGTSSKDLTVTVDQTTGDTVTSCHFLRTETNEKNIETKVQRVSERHFNPDGMVSDITRDLHGKRLQKHTEGPDTKPVYDVYYRYPEPAKKDDKVDPKGARAAEADTTVIAQQVGSDGSLKHQFVFANADAVEKQDASRRVDIHIVEDKPGHVRDTRESYDLHRDLKNPVIKSEHITDYNEGKITVSEQRYDGKTELQSKVITYDEMGRAQDFHFTSARDKLDISYEFTPGGKARTCHGETAGLKDQMLLHLADLSIAEARGSYDVHAMDHGSLLGHRGLTKPRDGDKNTGMVAYMDGNQLVQRTVREGIIYDGDKAVGQQKDNGDVQIGSLHFNIIKDSQFKAAFTGIGTDGRYLDLAAQDATGKTGFSGSISNGADNLLSVGGHIFGANKHLVGILDGSGKMTFSSNLEQAEKDGTAASTILHGGYRFNGMEDGVARHFSLDRTSHGTVFLPALDSKTGLPLPAKDGQMPPNTECELRLGMLIDKKTNQQIGNYVAPTENPDGTYRDGAVIINGRMIPLSAINHMSFSATVDGEDKEMHGLVLTGNDAKLVGAPNPDAGIVLNTDARLANSLENKKAKEKDCQQWIDDQETKTKYEVAGAAVPGVNLLVTGAVEYNRLQDESFEGKQTALDLATRHYDSDKAAVDKMMTTGQVDENLIFKLQKMGDPTAAANISQAQRLKAAIDNPSYDLEKVPLHAKVDGEFKRPDLITPGLMRDYSVDQSLVYKKGTKEVVGNVDPSTGTMRLFDDRGRLESTSIGDRKLTGSLLHFNYKDQSGKLATADWINDGTGRVQSVSQLRKQAAQETAYAQYIAKGTTSGEAFDALQRTKHLEENYNKKLSDIVAHGVTDVTNKNDGISSLDMIRGGPRDFVRDEHQRDGRHLVKPVIAPPALDTDAACANVSGPMRVGHKHVVADHGILYRTKFVKDQGWVSTGEVCGEMKAGYKAKIDGQDIDLQNDANFIFKMRVGDGPNAKEHMIMGLGEPRRDASGKLISGGLIDADEVARRATESKGVIDRSAKAYSDNETWLGIGYTVDHVRFSGREGQLNQISDGASDTQALLRRQIDQTFNEGLNSNTLTTLDAQHNVRSMQMRLDEMNLSAYDSQRLSQEGQEFQSGVREGTALALSAAVTGGTSLLVAGGSLSLVGGFAVAGFGGGLLTAAARQTRGSDLKQFMGNVGTGGMETMVMFGGGELGQVAKSFGVVSKNAKLLKVVEEGSELRQFSGLAKEGKLFDNLQQLAKLERTGQLATAGSEGLGELASNPSAMKLARLVSSGECKGEELKALCGILGDGRATGALRLASRGGPVAVKALEYTTTAGNAYMQASGFNVVNAVKAGDNPLQLTREKLTQGGDWMLAAEMATHLAHLPIGPKSSKALTEAAESMKKPTFVESLITTYPDGIINNSVYSALTASANAKDVEKQNIAIDQGIDISMVSDAMFERCKNESRMNAYIFDAAMDGAMTMAITHPFSHTITHGLGNYMERRNAPPEAPAARPDMALALPAGAGGERLALPAPGNLELANPPLLRDSEGQLVTKITGNNGQTIDLKYDHSGPTPILTEIKHSGGATWQSTDGVSWTNPATKEQFKGRCYAAADGSFVMDSGSAKMHYGSDGSARYVDKNGAEFHKVQGQITYVQDALGNKTNIAYDAQGRPEKLQIVSPDGNFDVLQHGPHGWTSKSRDGEVPLDGTVHVMKDGRIVLEDSMGAAHVRNLDGTLVTIEPEANKQPQLPPHVEQRALPAPAEAPAVEGDGSASVKPGADEPQRQTPPAAESVQREDGKITTITDANGKVSQFQYDAEGKLSHLDVTDAAGTTHWIRDESNPTLFTAQRDGFEGGPTREIRVTDDGRVITKSTDGLEHTAHLDGKSTVHDPLGSPNEITQLDRFDRLVEGRVSDPRLSTRIREDLHVFMERACTTDMDRKELAKSLEKVNEILLNLPENPEAAKMALQLVEEGLYLAAYPEMLSQGNHGTCPTAAMQQVEFLTEPSAMFEIAKQIVLRGSFTCPDGTVLRPGDAAEGRVGLVPDGDAQAHYGITAEERAVYQAKYKDKAVLDVIENKDRRENTRLLFSQMADEVFRSANTHLFGEKLYTSHLEPIMHLVTGKDYDFVVMNGRYDDSNNLLSAGNRDSSMKVFNTPEELAEVLAWRKANNKGPALTQVNVSHEPFLSSGHYSFRNRADEPEHCICISDVRMAGPADTTGSLKDRYRSDGMPVKTDSTGRPILDEIGRTVPDASAVFAQHGNTWDKNSTNRQVSAQDLFYASEKPLSEKHISQLQARIAGNPSEPASRLDLLSWRQKLLACGQPLNEPGDGHPLNKKQLLSQLDQVVAQEKQLCQDRAKALGGGHASSDVVKEINRLIDQKYRLEQLTPVEEKKLASYLTRDEQAFFIKAGDLRDRLKAPDAPTAPVIGLAAVAPQAERPGADGRVPLTDGQGPGLRREANDNQTQEKRAIDEGDLANKYEVKRRALAEAAGIDLVTGYKNFNGMMTYLDKACAEAQQSDKPFHLLYVDIRRFKAANDCMSREGADDALRYLTRHFAKTLNLSENELMARPGGDEIAIVLGPERTEEQVRDLVNQLESTRLACRGYSEPDANNRMYGMRLVGPDHPDITSGESPELVIYPAVGAVKFQPGDTAHHIVDRADALMNDRKRVAEQEKYGPMEPAYLPTFKVPFKDEARHTWGSLPPDELAKKYAPSPSNFADLENYSKLDPAGQTLRKQEIQDEMHKCIATANYDRFIELQKLETHINTYDRLSVDGKYRDLVDGKYHDFDGKSKQQYVREVGVQLSRYESLGADAQVKYLERREAFDTMWRNPQTSNPAKEICDRYLRRALYSDAKGDKPEHFSIIKADIDNMKIVNDRLGHDTGNKLLKHCGEYLRALIPADCFVGSPGGGGFVIIAPNSERRLQVEAILKDYGNPDSERAQANKSLYFPDIALPDKSSNPKLQFGFSQGYAEYEPSLMGARPDKPKIGMDTPDGLHKWIDYNAKVQALHDGVLAKMDKTAYDHLEADKKVREGEELRMGRVEKKKVDIVQQEIDELEKVEGKKPPLKFVATPPVEGDGFDQWSKLLDEKRQASPQTVDLPVGDSWLRPVDTGMGAVSFWRSNLASEANTARLEESPSRQALDSPPEPASAATRLDTQMAETQAVMPTAGAGHELPLAELVTAVPEAVAISEDSAHTLLSSRSEQRILSSPGDSGSPGKIQEPRVLEKDGDRVLFIRDDNGTESHIHHDSNGRLVGITEVAPDGTVREYNRIGYKWYERSGDSDQLMPGFFNVSPDGRIRFSDSSGWSYARAIDGKVTVREISRGSYESQDGKITTIRDAQGKVSQMTYDDAGQISRIDVSKGGEFISWTRDGSNHFIATKNGVPIGEPNEISVKQDGTMVFKLPNGEQHTSRPDGKTEIANLSMSEQEVEQRDRFEALINRSDIDPTLRNHLLNDFHNLSERIILEGRDRAEIANSLSFVNKMLEENPSAKMPLAERLKLAEEGLWLAGLPYQTSQGLNPTCNVTTLQVLQQFKHPSECLQWLSEIALTGEVRCADGRILRPFHVNGAFDLRMDPESASHYLHNDRPAGGSEDPNAHRDRIMGKRVFASRILQELFITACYADDASFKGHVVGQGNIGYHNNQISDMSHPVPVPLVGNVTKTDGSGHSYEEADKNPFIATSRIAKGLEVLTGRSENIVLAHERILVGQPAELTRFFDRSNAFNSPQGMAEKLVDLKRNGGYPVILQVNVSHEPFFSDGGFGNFQAGGEHVVSILGIDIPQDKSSGSLSTKYDKDGLPLNLNPDDIWVTVDNQWSPGAEHIAQKVRLSDLFIATTRPGSTEHITELQRQAIQEPENIDKQLELIRFQMIAIEKGETVIDLRRGHAATLEELKSDLTVLKGKTLAEFAEHDRLLGGATAKEYMFGEGEDRATLVPSYNFRRGAKSYNIDAQEQHRWTKIDKLLKACEPPVVVPALIPDASTPAGHRVVESEAPTAVAGDRHSDRQETGDQRLALRSPEHNFLVKNPARLHEKPGSNVLDVLLLRQLKSDYHACFQDNALRKFVRDVREETDTWQKIDDAASQTEKDQAIADRCRRLVGRLSEVFGKMGVAAPIIEAVDANVLGGDNAAYVRGEGKFQINRERFLDGKAFSIDELGHEGFGHLAQEQLILNVEALDALRARGRQQAGDLITGKNGGEGPSFQLTPEGEAVCQQMFDNKLARGFAAHADKAFIERALIASVPWLNERIEKTTDQLFSDPQYRRGERLRDSFENVKGTGSQELGSLANLLNDYPMAANSDQLRAFIKEALTEKVVSPLPDNVDPAALLNKMVEINRLYKYDPLDAKYSSDATDLSGKKISPRVDQLFESILTDPDFHKRHPDFFSKLVQCNTEPNGEVRQRLRKEWLEMIKSEYPTEPAASPTSPKVLARLDLKAYLFMMAHLKEPGAKIGDLPADIFKDALPKLVRELVKDNMRVAEIKDYHTYRANFYELEAHYLHLRMRRLIANKDLEDKPQENDRSNRTDQQLKYLRAFEPDQGGREGWKERIIAVQDRAAAQAESESDKDLTRVLQQQYLERLNRGVAEDDEPSLNVKESGGIPDYYLPWQQPAGGDNATDCDGGALSGELSSRPGGSGSDLRSRATDLLQNSRTDGNSSQSGMTSGNDIAEMPGPKKTIPPPLQREQENPYGIHQMEEAQRVRKNITPIKLWSKAEPGAPGQTEVTNEGDAAAKPQDI